MLCAALCCGGWVTSCSFAVKKAFNIIDKADAVCEFHSEMVRKQQIAVVQEAHFKACFNEAE